MATSTAQGRASQPPVDESTLGIQPVPAALRRLRAIDVGVLWGDLAVGVLVLAAGALLVTPTDAGGLGLGFGRALLAIAVGSVAGSVLLALVALAAHDRAVPTMALLRPVLGRYGSYGASVLNVVQLIGWTAFEFWAMALFADRVSDEVFGFSSFGLWLAVVSVVCTAMALAGPTRVVRAWLERFGVWIVLGACGYLTVYLLTRPGLGDLFDTPAGAAPFGSAVDLVVAEAPPEVGIPDVLELSEADARAELEAAGFAVRVREEDTPVPEEDGLVLDQSPAVGERRPEGSRVTIVVGRSAPEPTATPSPAPTATAQP